MVVYHWVVLLKKKEFKNRIPTDNAKIGEEKNSESKIELLERITLEYNREHQQYLNRLFQVSKKIRTEGKIPSTLWEGMLSLAYLAQKHSNVCVSIVSSNREDYAIQWVCNENKRKLSVPTELPRLLTSYNKRFVMIFFIYYVLFTNSYWACKCYCL